MSKRFKKGLIISAVIFGIGLILCLVVTILIGFDFSRLSTAVFEEKTKIIGSEFDEINIQDIEDGVVLKPSNDGKCKIVYYDSNKITHSIDVSENTLEIRSEYKDWTSYIFNINIGRVMTIYLPEKEYERLYISTVSGNINMGEFEFEDMELNTVSGNVDAYVSGQLDISTTSGDVNVTGRTDDKAKISSISGNIKLDKFISESLSVDTTSGNVYLDKSDADKINITTVSGDVGGYLIGDKEIHTDTVSGDINVPGSVKGKALCEINTVSGAIELKQK